MKMIVQCVSATLRYALTVCSVQSFSTLVPSIH